MSKEYKISRGWSFPPSFSKQQRGNNMSTDEEDIRQSIIIILSTKIGERRFYPELGSETFEHVFENMNYTNITRLQNQITETLSTYEPRIKINEVRIGNRRDEGYAIVHINYSIPLLQTSYNIHLPFALG